MKTRTFVLKSEEPAEELNEKVLSLEKYKAELNEAQLRKCSCVPLPSVTHGHLAVYAAA